MDLLEAVGKVAREPGTELHAVSDSAVNFADVILAACWQPSDVLVCTSACHVKMVAAVDGGRNVASIRVVVNYAMAKMNASAAKAVADRLGKRLLAARVHAKFAVIRQADRTLVVLTTGNFTKNLRSEAVIVTDDPEVAAVLTQLVADWERVGAEYGRPGAYYCQTYDEVLPGVYHDPADETLADLVRRMA